MKILSKILLLFLLIPLSSYTQNSGEIIKDILITKTEIQLDSFSIIPSTLSVYKTDSLLSDELYLINEIDAKIKIIDSCLINTTLTFRYKIYPVLLSKTYYNRKLNFIEGDNTNSYWERNKYVINKESSSQLFKEGELSRNILMGNNQNMSVLSNIDLRINGKLSNDLKIQAVISDNNLPFQEDGSSYKLQEFDKVFIRIYNEKTEIITGDIFTKNKSRFLNYQRKSKGIVVNNNRDFNSYNYKSSTSLSMSKGKYSFNNFLGIEGNQGPYKLKGKNGENYIVVLSGTEKVFMDGKLLKRGTENDYIIDYNTSEIIFTSNNLITKDKRFYVEFEYNDRSYAQSIITNHQKISSEKINFNFDFYSETDWKNQNYLTNLNDEERIIIAENGDNENDIFSSSVDSVSFSENKILYKKNDTIINGTNLIFYSYSVNPDSAKYQIRFTQTEENSSNYILKEEGINGKIFQWIPPIIVNDNLIPQGNFTPNIKLVSPKSKTIVSSELNYKLNKNTTIISNFTLQNFDKNLFSDLDDTDNTSIATYISLKNKIFEKEDFSVILANKIEYISAEYVGVNRFRDVEFNRNWNISNTTFGNQLMLKSDIKLLKKENEIAKFAYQNLRIDNYKTINKFSTNINLRSKNISFSTNSDYLKSKTTNSNSDILFLNSSISNNYKLFDVSLNLRLEEFSHFDSTLNLLWNSRSFTELESVLSNKNEKIKFSVLSRNDRKLSDFSKGNQIQLKLNILEHKNYKFNSNSTYRKLDYISDSLSNESNVLSSNNFSVNLLKNLFQIHTNYEIGKGKEAKKEQQFIKVPEGIGTHIWVDANNNNMQELDEFMIAQFQDEAEYVILLLPSTELEDVYILNYNHNIITDLAKVSDHKILNKFYFNSNFNLKNKGDNLTLNPFESDIFNSSKSYLFQNVNSVSINRNNKNFNLKVSNMISSSQNNFSYGNDMQKSNQNKIENNSKVFGVTNNLSVSISDKENISDFFENKNYKYKHLRVENKSFFQLKGGGIISAQYVKQKKENNSINIKLISDEIAANFTSSKSDKFLFSSELKYIHIKFSESENSILNYELLEGLKSGNNFLFTVNFTKKLKNNLQINLRYNARKSEKNSVKHVGNLGVTAYF